MAEALRRVNLTSVGDMKISLEKIKPDDKPSVLRASIEIVRAMPCKPDWLSIKGFAGTEGEGQHTHAHTHTHTGT